MQELPYTNVITFDDSKSETDNEYNNRDTPLVNLLNAWPVLAARAGEASWCASRSTAWETTTRETSSCTCTCTCTCLGVQFLHDGIRDGLEFLLLLVVLLH